MRTLQKTVAGEKAAKMRIGLHDFNLTEQDTRLVLFGSTVFKIKLRTSPELREAVRAEGRERAIQKDLKRVIFAILSQVLREKTLPLLCTDTITVYTGDCPWTACDQLYFAHHNQPLTAHPRVILILASLPPSPASLRLGKHRREISNGNSGEDVSASDSSSDYCTAVRGKRIRAESDDTEEESSFVPDPGEADLPAEEGRVVPDRHVVRAATEHTKDRLGQPYWTGVISEVRGKDEIEIEENKNIQNPEEKGEEKSFFHYVMKFLGWR